jgi:hypothetical protein
MIDYARHVWIFPGTDLEKEFFGRQAPPFDWFHPTNDAVPVEKDRAGNHIVPIFRGLVGTDKLFTWPTNT